MAYKGQRALSPWLLCLALTLLSPSALAAEASCLANPVLSQDWSELSVPETSQIIGHWRLAASAERPNQLTPMTATARLERRSVGRHRLVVEFDYGDPDPLGIHYTLQKLEFSVLTRNGRVAVSQDWSDYCSSPGIGLLPGDSLVLELEVPGPEGKDALFFPSLRLWGSQN